MSQNHVIVMFGGNWERHEYKDGEEEFLSIPPEGISRFKLLEYIHDIVQADVDNFDYVLHSLMESEEGRSVKMRLKNDDDVRLILASFRVPVIYVTIKKQNTGMNTQSMSGTTVPIVSGSNQQGFVNLLASHNAYGYRMFGDRQFPTGYGVDYQQRSTYPIVPYSSGPRSADYSELIGHASLPDIDQPMAISTALVVQPQSVYVEERDRISSPVLNQNDSLEDPSPVFDERMTLPWDNEARDTSDCAANADMIDNSGRSDAYDHRQGKDGEHDRRDDDGDHHNSDDHDDEPDYDDNDDDDDEDANFEDELQRSLFVEFQNWIRQRGGILPGNQDQIHVPSVARHDVYIDVFQNDSRVASTADRHVPAWVIPGLEQQGSPPRSQTGRLPNLSSGPLHEGATFMSKDDFVIAVDLYHLNNRVEYRVKRSCTTRCYIVCRHKTCLFLVTASGEDGMWRIVQFQGPHNCRLDLSRSAPRRLPSKIIGALFAPKLIEGHNLNAKDMQRDLQVDHDFIVNYNIALRGKHHAYELVFGDSEQSFSRLPAYLYTLKSMNSGSVTSLQLEESSNVFMNAFFALRASIDGFLNYCRPVIVIDGTHLKGKYKGILFVAVTKDGNEQVFPLAVGIGDKENNLSWTWFLKQVKSACGCPEDLLIVSDQHPSISNAIKTVYPGTAHGLCTYHLQNKVAKWGKHLVAMYHSAAYSYRQKEFDVYINNIKTASEDGAYATLNAAEFDRWARSLCPIRRYGFMTSNAAEAFNGRLRWGRRLPVCSLLECVRFVIEDWFSERRKEHGARDHELTEEAVNKLGAAVENGRTMDVRSISVVKFKVIDVPKVYVVDLSNRTCTCREFQLDLMPCSHASAAISYANQHLYSYVAEYYKTETLRKMYSGEVMPVPHPDDWIVPERYKNIKVKAPDNPRQAGRPRTRRVRSGAESSSGSKRTVCSRCRRAGHNAVSCTVYVPLGFNSEIRGGSGTAPGPSAPKAKQKRACSICRKPGHRANKCLDRPNMSVQRES